VELPSVSVTSNMAFRVLSSPRSPGEAGFVGGLLLLLSARACVFRILLTNGDLTHIGAGVRFDMS
jgi:hypothetical protein